MRIGKFEVDVSPGRESVHGYVEMDEGTQYVLSLRNHGGVRCDAEVTVDGKDMGAFRIDAWGVMRIERPVNDQGRFTFYKAGTKAGDQAGLGSVSDADLGLISVRFRPEFNPAPVRPKSVARGSGILRGQSLGSYSTPQDSGEGALYASSSLESEEKTSGGIQSRGLSAGGTGLSGHSSQQFIEVAELNYDRLQEVVINLRLVCRVPEVNSVSSPRQLQPVSNVVPAPVPRG